MAKMIRMISEDGSAVACAINSTDIVSEIEKIHKTSAVVTAALGRLTTAASIMGYMLKGEKDSLTLRFDAGGPSGVLIAVSDSRGNVKSYVQNPVVEIPLNEHGKLDVRGAVGTSGTFSVIKDLGLKEPYVGRIPVVSGEIAEDVTSYYAVSEQTPTVCGLGVLVNPDLTVKSAGGYFVMLLPFASEEVISTIENNIKDIPPVSSMFSEGFTEEEICAKLLAGLNPNLLDEAQTEYRCDCSDERVKKALISLGAKELTEIKNEDKKIEVDCHFCNKKYRFSEEEIDTLIKEMK